jgi:nucleoside-diphosphate-sugar epimerase
VRLAVTGAGGFVGRHVVAAAAAAGHEAVGLVRSEAAERVATRAGGRAVRIGGLAADELTAALAGADVLVHLAQIGAERGGATYAAVNVDGTRQALHAALRAGVPRVVFFSGLGVARYGIARRCTNAYFLSKLQAEAALFASGLEVAVFRPSFVVGPGDGYVPSLVRDMARGEVEQIGDGTYRMQPIAVRDAAACVLAAAPGGAVRHRVFDLVGPEPIACRELFGRVGRLARDLGLAGAFRTREVPVAEAEGAARTGAPGALGPDELDCMLCDEVSDPAPLEALLGRFLTPLDDALAAAIRSA